MAYENNWFDAIEIEEALDDETTREIMKMYIVKIDFESLSKMVKIRSLSTNRGVDYDRVEDIVDYIRQPNNFFPPLILSTARKNTLKYDSEKKRIQINVRENDSELIVIDGQHRFSSIQELVSEGVVNENKKRFQAVFLIDNISEFRRRKAFMDINDKAVNVSVGTKERFKITIDNYISLGTVYALKDDLRGLSIAISMDDNQLRDSTIEKYTYKTIIKANREILKRIQKDYNAKRIKLDQIKKLFPLFKIIWSQFFILINDNKDKLIVRLEIFPIEICKYLKDDFEKHVYKEDFINLKDEINAEDFKNFLQPKVTKISEKINEINTKIEEFKNISERKKIISDWLKEETI